MSKGYSKSFLLRLSAIFVGTFLLFSSGTVSGDISAQKIKSKLASVFYPENNAACIDLKIPDKVIAGGTYKVSINCWNTGNIPWTFDAGYKLGSANPYNNDVWGITRVHLGKNNVIRPLQVKHLEFKVTAPSEAGTYDFDWQMLRENFEWFGNIIHQEVAVISCGESDCSTFLDQSVPTIMTAGQRYDTVVTMKNNGSTTWLGGNLPTSYSIGVEKSDVAKLWSISNKVLDHDVAPGEEVSFRVRIKAPSKLGDYTLQWRMHSQVQGINVEPHFFGESSEPVTIKVLDDLSSIIMESDYQPCYSAPLNNCGPGLATGITPWTFWTNDTGRIVKMNRIKADISFSNLADLDTGYGLDVCFYLFDENDKPAWSEDYLLTDNPDPYRVGVREHGCGGGNAMASVKSSPKQNEIVFPYPVYLKPNWKVAVQSALWSADPNLSGTAKWEIGVANTKNNDLVESGPGLEIIRFPIVDKVFPIGPHGEAWTTWETRVNNTDETLYIWGMQSFFSLFAGAESDGCLYVFTTRDGTIVPKTSPKCYPHQNNNGTSYINPGGINFSEPIAVEPGEYFVAHHYFKNNNDWEIGADGGFYINLTKGMVK